MMVSCGMQDGEHRPTRVKTYEVFNSFPKGYITHPPLVPLQSLLCSSSALRASDLRNSPPQSRAPFA